MISLPPPLRACRHREHVSESVVTDLYASPQHGNSLRRYGKTLYLAYLQVSHPCKIFIEMVNVRTALKRIATSLAQLACEE